MSTEQKFELENGALSDARLQKIRADAERWFDHGALNYPVVIPELIELIENYRPEKLDFDTYQNNAARTAIYPGQGGIEGLMYVALGLAGEAGEFANKVKKIYRDSGGKIPEAMRYDLSKELGDIMWYTSMGCVELSGWGEYPGITYGNTAHDNNVKLLGRQERGTLGGSGDER